MAAERLRRRWFAASREDGKLHFGKEAKGKANASPPIGAAASGVPMPHRRNADSEAAERLRGSAERRVIEIEEMEVEEMAQRPAVATNRSGCD